MNINRQIIFSFLFVVFAAMIIGVSTAEDDNMSFVGHIGGSISDVAVVGNYAYVGEGQDFVVLDITDVNNPIEVGKIATPALLNDISISGDYAYITEKSSMVIVDISNPSLPINIGSYSLTNSLAMSVTVSGDYAYVSCLAGFVVLDISNPSTPTLAGRYTYTTYPASYTSDIIILGNYAYVPFGNYGLHIVDVSNPPSPTRIAIFNTDVSQVAISGDYAYATCGDKGLVIIDISNLSSPTLVGSYNPSDARPTGVAVSGNYAYIANANSGDNGLTVIDVTNVSSPKLVGKYATGYSTYVALSGNQAYVVNSRTGLAIVNIADVSSPKLLASYNSIGEARDVSVSGNYAYVPESGGLSVIDIKDPSSPKFVGDYYNGGTSYTVALLGNYAYLASGNRSLVIVDISNPSSPKFASSCDTGFSFYSTDINLANNYAYIAYNGGLAIIDIANPLSPRLMGQYRNANVFATGVVVEGNYAYVAVRDSGLIILDIADPSAPTLVGSYSTGGLGLTDDIAVAGNYAYLANGGLSVVDVSDRSAPSLISKLAVTAQSIDVSGNYAYVGGLFNGFYVIDITNASLPTIVAHYGTAGIPYNSYIKGDYVYVADERNGLVILKTDIQNQAPIEESLVQVEGSPDVYLIENGEKRYFTSPEALEWNGYSFSDVTYVSSETLTSIPNGADISISQAIIDKYYALDGSATFGQPVGTGELNGEVDQDGIYCSYVNFEKGAIECFANGPNAGKSYAIVDQFYTKWASMGYGASVLGYPIGDMSEEKTSSKNTPYKYQLFTNGTQLGALEWNLNANQICEVHGAIFAKWAEIGFGSSVLGLSTGDEQDIASSKYGTVGRYGTFENGHIHWNQATGLSFVTHGALNECYNNIQGTQSDLGFPIMSQVGTTDGHDYCEFEKGYIEWNANSGKYEPNYSPNINQKINTRLKKKPQFPPYLLDPNYVGSTSVLWMQFSNFALNTDLTKKYDEFYKNGIYYYNLETSCLFYAKKSLSNNDISSAEKFVQKADKMQKLSDMSFCAANDVFLGNIDSAELFAKFIKDESETILSVLAASSGATIPSTAIKVSQVLTPLYIATDYWKDIQIEGLDQANKNAMIAIFIQVTIHNIDFNDLNGKTVEEFINEPINNIPSELLRQQLKDAAKETGVTVSEKALDYMINSYREIMSQNVFLSSYETVTARCPVELQVYDSKGDVTGTVNGTIKEEIPNSIYDNDTKTVLIYMANDTYSYEVVGTSNGTYDLEIVHSENATDKRTTIENVTISTNSRDRYTIYWPHVTTDKEVVPYIPVINFSSNVTEGYAPLSVQFTDLSENATSRKWDFGDGYNSTEQSPTHTYPFAGIYTVNLTISNANGTASKLTTINVLENHVIPPQSISDVQSTIGTTWINFTWTNPSDSDFNHTEIYLNNIFQTNTSAEYFNATGLEPETDYTIGTRTVDIYGNVNETWVNLTATTKKAPIIVEAGTDQTMEEGISVDFGGSFTASGTHTYSFHWDFGDGANESGSLTPSHVYEDDGIYEVTLTVTDDEGDIDTDTLNVTVTNVAPSVDAGDDQIADEGSSVIFSGNFIDRGADDIHTTDWDFGDGANASGSLVPVHAYGENGTYTVTLTVTDDDGGIGTDFLTVTVRNVPPQVDAGDDFSAFEGNSIDFSGSFTDPGIFDTHTILWDFGDGSTVTGDLVPSHTYADDGVYAVTLAVKDDDGGASVDSLNVTVNNAVPEVEAGNDFSAVEGDPVDFSGSFTDLGVRDTHTVMWDFGDGSTYSGDLNFSHTYADDGLYTVTLNVMDDDGGIGTDILNVTVINSKPLVVAGPDLEVTAGDQFSFEGTFTDAGWLDTHTAEWSFGEGITIEGSLSEENGNPESKGTVSDVFTYFEVGVHTVTLTVTDDDGGIELDQFTVTVNPIVATVDFGPDTLNLNSRGKWVTAYIELPDGYDVSKIDAGSVVLNDEVKAVTDQELDFVINEDEYITDDDENGIPERMVKFSRTDVGDLLKVGDAVKVTISGKVWYDNGIDAGFASFEAIDTERVMESPKKEKGGKKK